MEKTQKIKTPSRKIVDDGLELTRKNLLDLSGRNRLLNFKHTGSKILRFVDESPNHIYAEMVEDSGGGLKKGFLISPVPLPKKSDYPDLIEQKDLKAIEVKSHARKLGINTDWEMEANSNPQAAKHIDDKLQALHYPEELDRIVRRIQSEARTAIEESGVNMLFLCLGYLKWNDSDNSEVFYNAPLIMIPIEIERDKIDARTGFTKFRVQYSGEDILDNICLREKLRQLSIELPSFDEFESPESYFSALTKRLGDIKPEWAIQRFMTIGFLSFGKMLMYLDLHPNRWMGNEGIDDAAHILDIFAGNHSGDGSIASEFDIDGDKKIRHIAQVMDADSSQHSAIIDVLNGRNLVIEGPPGTGKSQTITNLIAACLEQGKTVLFVAEKSAALKVVRKRLDSLGLGDFCLELHSHKTQKKVVLADLKKRLELNTEPHRLAANTAETRLQELNQKKAKLIEYVKAVNAPFGKVEESPHQIFWKAEVLQKNLSQSYKVEIFAAPRDVDQLSPVTIRTHIDAIRNLTDNLREYFEDDYSRKEHYWYGFNPLGPIEYAAQQDNFKLLQNLYEASKTAVEANNQLRSFNLSNNTLKTYKIDRLEESDFIYAQYFKLLDILNANVTLDKCIDTLQTYQKHLEDYLSGLNKHGLSAEQVELLDESVFAHIQLPQDLTLVELRSLNENIGNAIAVFTKSIAIFKESVAHLGLVGEMDSLAALEAILKVSSLCEKISKNDLNLRNASIEAALENPLILELPTRILKLREMLAELKMLFNLDDLPLIQQLNKTAIQLKSTKPFSRLSSNWRTARNGYNKIATHELSKDYKTAAANTLKLITFIKEEAQLKEDADYATLLPGIFKGIDTNIENLEVALNYYKKLSSELMPIPIYGARLYNSVRSLEPPLYAWFSQNNKELSEALLGLKSASSFLAAFNEPFSLNSVKNIVDKAKSLHSEFNKLEPHLAAASIVPTITLKQIVEAITEFKAASKAKNLLLQDETVQKLGFTDGREKLSEQIQILKSLSGVISKTSRIFPVESTQHILNDNGYLNLLKIKELLSQLDDYHAVKTAVTKALTGSKTLAEFWNYNGTEETELLAAIIAKLETLELERESYNKWCEVINNFADIRSQGLEQIITSFANSTDTKVPFSDYAPCYNYLVYHFLSHEALRQNKALGSFVRITHENIRASFKEIDLELQKLNARKLIRLISSRPLPEGSSGRSPKEFTDARLIRHEIGKQTKHIPIRQLVNRAFDALVAMKPCLMMGPLSVAQYIPPFHDKFDILIMDEASQVKPEDAIGVLARAKQVVVVGDSNQLPPTGFFDTLGADNDTDDETTIENSESILDVCKPLFQPLRRLRWHYRSQHQSLISFSNNHFYENDLIIFPSPTANSESMGVKHVYVSDGIYSSQSNPIEAKRIVEEIMQMVQQRPNISYGIVTLNAKQKIVIEDEIERVRKDNPIFDNFISESANTDEEFFVKNLETVQGDERDVIFISTTFGLTEEGVFKQNFGPINGKDGWRRLNVLFTRAKQHVRIFSSFLPERITVDDTKEQRGKRALKDYLNYAITGSDNHSYLTGQEPDSDFEKAVGEYLKSQGYDVVYQLGVAGYRIDLVVKHPKCPTDYVIAIECDGATYHSARSARDRDRLREDNLRNLGWSHIHRIWSTDWFRRREQEQQRLLLAVESAVNARVLAAA